MRTAGSSSPRIEETGAEVRLRHDLAPKEREILLAGGLLGYLRRTGDRALGEAPRGAGLDQHELRDQGSAGEPIEMSPATLRRHRRPVVTGMVRGAVAAMAMSALRQVTTGLGLVEQTPPDAILKQRAFGLLVRAPRLAFFVARRQIALVELAHWSYGAAGGAAFALLPRSFVRSELAGPAYGLATWTVFELSIAPVLGLAQATRIRATERIMFAADHVLYGVILAGDRTWALSGGRASRVRRRLAGS